MMLEKFIHPRPHPHLKYDLYVGKQLNHCLCQKGYDHAISFPTRSEKSVFSAKSAICHAKT